MATFDDWKNDQSVLIRKALEGAVFIAPYATGTEVTAITDGTSSAALIALPAEYEAVGFITKDQGMSWSSDVETSDTMSMGYAGPTRRDIVSKVAGLTFTMQETNRLSLQLTTGVDLSAVTADGTSGEVTFDEPDRPADLYYKVLAIFKDGDGSTATYVARWLPRAAVTSVSEQSWQEGQETQYGVTLTAFHDAAAGTSMRHFFGGPGWLANQVAAGF